MPYRGRLIWRHVATIGRVDTTATAAVDPLGPDTTGYDDIFNEPRVVGEEAARTEVRVETLVTIPCQLEPDFLRKIAALANGQDIDSDAEIVLHFRDIEAQDLLDDNNEPVFQKGDRLVNIKHEDTDAIITTIPTPPGLYLSSWFYSFGLRGKDRNLMIMQFNARPRGA